MPPDPPGKVPYPSSKNDPVDPLSAMAVSAVQLHELYLALQGGGFTKPEALSLLAQIALGQR